MAMLGQRAIILSPRHHNTLAVLPRRVARLARRCIADGHDADRDLEARVPVFQLTSMPPCHITLEDVRDAVEACDVPGITPEQRRRCMETFGLDARKVDQYFEPVVALESLATSPEDEAGRKVAGAGSMLFALFVAQKLCGA